MKLTDAAKQFEECQEAGEGCLVDNCPLAGQVEVNFDSDFDGELHWKIEGCLVMGKLMDILNEKEPGTPR